jgi:DNA-binding response OmpR family regulator
MAKKRVLFVDNRPEYLAQPVLRLRVAGYEVDDAASGEEGLRRIREAPYDLVIVDSELPDEDGWDVLKEVRADPVLEGTKAIVLMAGKGETGRLVLIPVDAELRRPFSIGTLLETVHRVIGPP